MDQPDAEDFVGRLEKLRASGAISDGDLAKDAPTALLRLAEIERFHGQFDLAEKDYAKAASVAGLTGDKARAEMTSLMWDSKLRQAFGRPFDDEIVAAARQVRMDGKAEQLLIALWRSPHHYSTCDYNGLFDAAGNDPGTLALYRLSAEGNPTQQGEPFKLDDAVDIGLLEILPDGRALVEVSLVDGGNCFACENGAANFLVQNETLYQLKDPGVGRIQGAPSVSNGEVSVTTLDTRWEHFGRFAHVYGSSIPAYWTLKGQHFVEDCGQMSGAIDPTPLQSIGDVGSDFQRATQRFLEPAQGGQVEAAWKRYRADLKAISDWWPDQKARLNKLTKMFAVDLKRSKAEMARHACHLEGLRLRDDCYN